MSVQCVYRIRISFTNEAFSRNANQVGFKMCQWQLLTCKQRADYSKRWSILTDWRQFLFDCALKDGSETMTHFCLRAFKHAEDVPLELYLTHMKSLESFLLLLLMMMFVCFQIHSNTLYLLLCHTVMYSWDLGSYPLLLYQTFKMMTLVMFELFLFHFISILYIFYMAVSYFHVWKILYFFQSTYWWNVLWLWPAQQD